MKLVLLVILVGAGMLLLVTYVRNYLLRSGRWPDEQVRIERRTAAYVRRTYTRCPVCGRDLVGHLFREIASVVEPTDERIALMDAAAKEGSWATLTREIQWSGSLDALIYCLLECPEERRASLYRVESRAAFDQDDLIRLVGVLSEEATADCVKHVRNAKVLTL